METEQAQKTAVIEEQQRRIRQRKEQKLQQEHDKDNSCQQGLRHEGCDYNRSSRKSVIGRC